MRTSRRVWPIPLLVLSLGCTLVINQQKPSVAGEKTHAAFCGIERSLDEGKPARVLIIHGMGWHESQDYDRDFRENLRRVLHLEPLGCAGPYPIVNPGDPYNVYGGVLRCTFERKPDGARVRIFNLLWSPMTMPYKVGALGYDYDRPYAGERVRINGALKEELIDKAFSDAVLYSGKLAQAMRYSVQQSICAAMTDQINLSAPCGSGARYNEHDSTSDGDLFVITHSLGSAMLFETLGDLKAGTGEWNAASQLIQQVKLIAMMANQLPLIALSRLEKPPEDGVLAPRSSQAAELFGARTKPIKVVAFSDINDLLTFPIPESWKTSLFPDYASHIEFINYPVTNGRFATLGMFVNPAQAHTGYWTNGRILDAITHGLDCTHDK